MPELPLNNAKLLETASLLMRRQGHRTTLHTDFAGRHSLGDVCLSAFDRVTWELEDIPKFLKHTWAMGKLWTYAMQDGPFWHIDHDMLQISEIPQALLEADYVCEKPERVRVKMESALFLPPLPPELLEGSLAYRISEGWNAGILGGQQGKVIAQWYQEMIMHIAAHSDEIECAVKEQGRSSSSVLCEQTWYGLKLRESGVVPTAWCDHQRPGVDYYHLQGPEKHERDLTEWLGWLRAAV